ncbi:MAG TPA: ThiF family adenylyltransferase [Gemmatales bacterium]|nr:ThiF family adenylyltransferase [Gemmatales bacterium]
MSTSTLDLTRRNIRQRDLVPPERLAGCNAIVIGVGAIGRQVALQLAAIGVRCMALYDPDRVTVENLAPQGFWESDLRTCKVTAVSKVAQQQFPKMELHTFPERFRKSHVQKWSQQRPIAVFCCVDSIEARKLIWEAVKHRAGFFTDGRMAAEVIRVLACDVPSIDRHYQTTLFAAGEAYAGECTSKSTIYTASIAAGLMVGQFTRWLRQLPIIREQVFNLLAQELVAS